MCTVMKRMITTIKRAFGWLSQFVRDTWYLMRYDGHPVPGGYYFRRDGMCELSMALEQKVKTTDELQDLIDQVNAGGKAEERLRREFTNRVEMQLLGKNGSPLTNWGCPSSDIGDGSFIWRKKTATLRQPIRIKVTNVDAPPNVQPNISTSNIYECRQVDETQVKIGCETFNIKTLCEALDAFTRNEVFLKYVPAAVRLRWNGLEYNGSMVISHLEASELHRWLKTEPK